MYKVFFIFFLKKLVSFKEYYYELLKLKSKYYDVFYFYVYLECQ